MLNLIVQVVAVSRWWAFARQHRHTVDSQQMPSRWGKKWRANTKPNDNNNNFDGYTKLPETSSRRLLIGAWIQPKVALLHCRIAAPLIPMNISGAGYFKWNVTRSRFFFLAAPYSLFRVSSLRLSQQLFLFVWQWEAVVHMSLSPWGAEAIEKGNSLICEWRRNIDALNGAFHFHKYCIQLNGIKKHMPNLEARKRWVERASSNIRLCGVFGPRTQKMPARFSRHKCHYAHRTDHGAWCLGDGRNK